MRKDLPGVGSDLRLFHPLTGNGAPRSLLRAVTSPSPLEAELAGRDGPGRSRCLIGLITTRKHECSLQQTRGDMYTRNEHF